MKKDVDNFLDESRFSFSREDFLVLALSGGPDSVFLGEQLRRAGFQNIVAAHFNHQLRGEESNNDQIFCSNKATEWKWQYETENWQTPQQSEERARIARYEFLERVRKQYQAKAIVLGHHADDQVETIFFQFLRGSGLKGLTGMKEWDKERKLSRPLLHLEKSQILEWLEEKSIAFCLDSTNAESTNFSRNFLRLEVLPLLKEHFSGFPQSILRNAEVLKEIDSFLEKTIASVWHAFGEKDEEGRVVQFSRETFFAFEKILQAELIKKIFTTAGIRFLSSDQNREVLEFIENANSGKQKSIGKTTLRVYGQNVFLEYCS